MQRRKLGKGPGGIACSPRFADAGGGACDIGEQFIGFANCPPPICAQPQLHRLAQRGPHFNPPAQSGGRNVKLIDGGGRGCPPCIDGNGAAGEFAQLNIGQRLHPPIAAMDKPQARIRPIAAIFGKKSAPFPPVGKAKQRGLKFRFVRQGDNTARGQCRLLIRGGPIHAAALPGDNWDEAVTAGVTARDKAKSAADTTAQKGAAFNRLAAALGQAGGQAIGLPADTVHFNRARQRARPIDARSTAARDAHLAQTFRRIGRPADPAAKGVALRHTIEHEQGAARRIAAQPAQCGPLAGRIGRAGVAAAKLAEARNIAQHIFDSAGRRGDDPIAVNPRHIISGVPNRHGQRLPCDNNLTFCTKGRAEWRDQCGRDKGGGEEERLHPRHVAALPRR